MKKQTRATFGIIGLALCGGVSQASAAGETLLGDDVTGGVTVGWDSRYFFRGLWFGDDTAWVNAEISKPFSDRLTGSVNLFYTDVADSGIAYSEGNIGANLSYDAGFGTFDFGFIYYRFFDGFAGDSGNAPVAGNTDATELNVTYTQEICCGWDLHATAAYDLRIEGVYLEVGLSKSWKITDAIGMDFSVSTGYSIGDYYTRDLSISLGASTEPENGFTHTVASLAFPMALTETTTFTPHVTANFSHEARDAVNALSDRDEVEVFWGASLGVSF